VVTNELEVRKNRLSRQFIELGFPEPVDLTSSTLTAEHIRKLQRTLQSIKASRANESISENSFPRRVVQPTSKWQSLLTAKAGDYAWVLRQRYEEFFQDDNALKRFEYLEGAMFTVNDHVRSLLSIDVKVIRGEIREIGLALWDPKMNTESKNPVIKSMHIILEEHWGVLSTNNYHGESLLMSRHESVKLIQALMEKYPSVAIVGFKIPQIYEALTKLGVKIPKPLGSVLDVYFLYIVPLLMKKQWDGETWSKLVTLQSVLMRFKMPTTHLGNPGDRAHFTMLALLDMMNPYERLRISLDNPDENFKAVRLGLSTEFQEMVESETTYGEKPGAVVKKTSTDVFEEIFA
jgi:hypothetical protein